MPTNQYVNNYYSVVEQSLHESLIIESIKFYGIDVYYLPRTLSSSLDRLRAEDTRPEYTSAYLCEMYIKNVEGFEGEGDFLSKFNIQIRDQMTFTVARQPFIDNVSSSSGQIRPNEGDIIYFPLNEKIFQVKFVEHEAMFYPLGSLQTYDLRSELFEYGGERFATGIPAIDNLVASINTELSAHSLLTEDGLVLVTEEGYAIVDDDYDAEAFDPSSDNDIIQREATEILDFTEFNPFSEGPY